jgi:hypothetical protein
MATYRQQGGPTGSRSNRRKHKRAARHHSHPHYGLEFIRVMGQHLCSHCASMVSRSRQGWGVPRAAGGRGSGSQHRPQAPPGLPAQRRCCHWHSPQTAAAPLTGSRPQVRGRLQRSHWLHTSTRTAPANAPKWCGATAQTLRDVSPPFPPPTCPAML